MHAGVRRNLVWQRTDVAYVVTGLKSSKRSPSLACRSPRWTLLDICQTQGTERELRRPPPHLRDRGQ